MGAAPRGVNFTMADRTNPFLKIGYSEYVETRQIPFDLKEDATKHEHSRQRVVISILLDLHLMALSGFIARSAAIGLRGAVMQNLEGHQGNAAAHCVPRQLIISGRPAQDVLAQRMPERALALAGLFGETDVLPVNFNICDSRAERRGLNSAFLNSSQQVINAGRLGGEIRAESVATVVRGAFDKYKSDARVAFQSSVQRLKDKLKPAYLFPHLQAKWTEQLQITEQYADALASPADAVQKKTDLTHIKNMIYIYTLQ